MNKTELFARVCDITKKGMNEGFCIGDGAMYIKDEVNMIKHLREVEKEGNPDYDEDVSEGRLTDDYLLNEYYNAEYYYFTDWYDVIDKEEDVLFNEEGEEIKL
tara:strand:+ start:508 stop:816 length:309 start_codon:yes stop_codon:yes gene_type:complete